MQEAIASMNMAGPSLETKMLSCRPFAKHKKWKCMLPPTVAEVEVVK